MNAIRLYVLILLVTSLSILNLFVSYRVHEKTAELRELSASISGAGTPGVPSTSAVSSPGVASLNTATVSSGQTCFLSTGNGQAICSPSPDIPSEEEVYAVGSLTPNEIRGDKAAMAAFKVWVLTLPDGKAKTAYLWVLNQYDEANKQQELIKEREKRAAEFLKGVPRAVCSRKGADFECATSK